MCARVLLRQKCVCVCRGPRVHVSSYTKQFVINKFCFINILNIYYIILVETIICVITVKVYVCSIFLALYAGVTTQHECIGHLPAVQKQLIDNNKQGRLSLFMMR
jgi:hypothetical protein